MPVRCCNQSRTPFVCFAWCSGRSRPRGWKAQRLDSEDDFWSLDEYLQGRFLGRGPRAKVHHAIRRCNGENVAVKEYCRGQETHVAEEVDVLQSLSHPCIVRFEELHVRTDAMYVVMELLGDPLPRLITTLCEQRYLCADPDHVRPYTEDYAQTAVTSLLQALLHAHERGVAHENVRPEALLCAARRPGREGPFPVKLAGWGDASALGAFVTKPELLPAVAPQNNAPGANEAVRRMREMQEADMRGVGLVALALLTGVRPADDDSEALPPLPVFGPASAHARDFCAAILDSAQGELPTAGDALKLPWLAPTNKSQSRLRHVPFKLLTAHAE